MRIVRFFVLMTLSSCGFQNSGSQRSVEDAADTLKAINTKLELLNQKQGIVPIASPEVETISNVAENRRIQSRIIRNITLIDSSMRADRASIHSLGVQIGETRRQIAALEQGRSEMQKAIEAGQMENERLKIGLERSGITNASLQDSLRAAYLITAPADSLEKWKIIEKNGSMPRLLGSTFRLSGYLPLKKFTRLDKLKTNKVIIPASARNVMVMTLHDCNTYLIREESTTPAEATRQHKASCTLLITDPVRFWAASNALVIKIDN
jgi:hypothetical protein